MNIPITITLARLLAVPLIVHLILEGRYGWAFVAFALAGVSDAVDGTIATLLHQRSRAGRILDPLADKALIVSVYIVLGLQGAIAMPVVAIVVLRDFLIVCGVGLMVLLNAPFPDRAAQLSRINTGVQVFFVAVVLGDLALALDLLGMVDVLGYVVIASTIASGSWYLVWCWRRLLRPERVQ